ncbi:MAG: tryptophan synthase subunit alpha [Gemmatimonadetes bacterium]|nr:tryptophan synthase subunit alpha [Gemmatimonadota bacterium]
MNRIEETFASLKTADRKALIPYIMAGDPDLDTTAALVVELDRRGADLVELGVPFSDPIADGPTIQRAALRALDRGTTLRAIVDTVASIRKQSTIPIVLMTYYNPVLAYGTGDLCRDAARAGVDGLIVPDLPPEEGTELSDACRRYGLTVVFLVAPTSTAARIELVSRHTTGFVYCVSLTGVTGARGKLADGVDAFMAQVRSRTDRPLGLGFGISSPEQAREAARMADGVIVGSAIINEMEAHAGEPDMVRSVGEYVASLRTGIDRETPVPAQG